MTIEARSRRGRHRSPCPALLVAAAAFLLAGAACGDGTRRSAPTSVEPPGTPAPGLAAEPGAKPQPALDEAAALGAGEAPFEPPALAVARVDGRQHVTIELLRRPGVALPPGPVPYTDEPYNISTQPGEPTVREADILATGLALDLDGDGRTDGAFGVSCDADGAGRFGDTRIAPLLSPPTDPDAPVRYTYPAGDGPIGRLGPRGAHAVLYSPCDGSYVSLGLSPADQPLSVRATDGPALQVLVLEAVAGPGDAPRPGELAIRPAAGAAPSLLVGWAYEPFFGPDPQWASMRWTMLPLADDAEPQRVVVDLPDDGVTRLVLTSVNVSPAPGIRLRFPVRAVTVP
jgi:hypothetical protein